MSLRLILLAGAGGAAGSMLRFLLSYLIQIRYLSSFPYGTFFVNITGCLLAGLIYVLYENTSFSAETRILLMTGFCGGFTTFSAFSQENIVLLKSGEFGIVLAYTALSVVLGFAATYAGMLVARLF